MFGGEGQSQVILAGAKVHDAMTPNKIISYDGLHSRHLKEVMKGGAMKTFEDYCQKALEMGMDGAKVIDPRCITTAEWVRLKCQFGCHGFGESLCCPPHTPSPEITRKVLDSYQSAILFHKKIEGGPGGEPPVNPRERRDFNQRRDFNESIFRIERALFLDGYYKAWSMGSGACRYCKECDPKGFCRQSFKARPSMEACGIDVYKTATDSGFSINVLKTFTEEMNVFGVVLVE
jgi:predicted metal-binding protein